MASLTSEQLDLILTRDIVPMTFPPAADEREPTLTLLHVPRGSGAARATARLASTRPAQAVLSAADLRAFHPSFEEARGAGSERARSEVDAAVAEWFRACLVYARGNHRSLLIEGPFMTPATAAGTAQGFADAGFATRVAVVATSRAEALLTTMSVHLRSMRAQRPEPLPSRKARERDWESTGDLVAAMADSAAVGRAIVIGRSGEVEANVTHGDPGGSAAVGAALRAAQERPLTALLAAQWLSELRRMTDFIDSRREPMVEVREALVELHVLGIREIVPRLPVPAGSEVVSREERRLSAELVRLRRSIPTAERPDATGPVVAGPSQGPEGPSR
ncbi:zeta toxin family protein [Microbacterium sulfonylureivorans]|uniref:zeta toxin family protein n=1 Tax=Microbacterium sulfonylureivorans TaxID=2486854 RepID=UPI000FD703A2|nr:zeta toxin family protein [Microbacterium sulfonylureivorans]